MFKLAVHSNAMYAVFNRLQKVVDKRPNHSQLLEHPFIKKYDKADIDMASFVTNILDKHMPPSS